MVDILRLDDSFEIIFQHLGKIVCLASVRSDVVRVRWDRSPTLQFGATEILQDFLPVRRVVISTEVGLELSTQYLERRALPNTVCAHESQHLPRAGHGQSVQLEAVGGITVGDLGLQVRGQVDDVDGIEGALFRADATSDTQPLGNEGDLGVGRHFDAQLARADDGTRFLAFLSAFLGWI